MDQDDEKNDFCALTATVQSRVNSDFLHTIAAFRLGELFRLTTINLLCNVVRNVRGRLNLLDSAGVWICLNRS